VEELVEVFKSKKSEPTSEVLSLPFRDYSIKRKLEDMRGFRQPAQDVEMLRNESFSLKGSRLRVGKWKVRVS